MNKIQVKSKTCGVDLPAELGPGVICDAGTEKELTGVPAATAAASLGAVGAAPTA